MILMFRNPKKNHLYCCRLTYKFAMNWTVFEKIGTVRSLASAFQRLKNSWLWAFLEVPWSFSFKGSFPGKKTCHDNSSLSNVVGEGLASHNVLAPLPGRRKTKGALRRRKTDEINILLDQLATFAKTFYSRWTSLEWKFHESCPVISWFQGTNLSECQQKWSNWTLSSCFKYQ